MKVGSLCTGYGGLDMAVGGDLAWVSDIDKAANTLLEYRHPTIPNLGDLKVVDWSAVEPVDVVTAGYPCQPFSVAGKQKGIEDDRHIWPWIAEAIRVVRPGLVVLENVPGHLRLGFGEVLGSLAQVGYDARWVCVRASDVGAPHRRERLFILATDAPRDPRRILNGDGLSPTDADQPGLEGAEPAQRSDVSTWGDYGPAGPPADTEINEQREPIDRGQVRAEPWDGTWGDYQPAITQWEHVTGRAAPAPTTTGTTGRAVLNPPFVEWMMGLPAGWVTDVPGISRAQQLKILGNGVVPQQARHALDLLGGDVLA